MAPHRKPPSYVEQDSFLVDDLEGLWNQSIRGPSTLTANRELYTRHVSLELLNPTHDSALRKSTPLVAMFNLVATVCGGGVLSLPLAFYRAGIVPASILMVFSALITDFAVYILCSCARRTGGRSYSDVARSSFGRGAELATTVLLFLLLSFILIAYMVLAKDIWTPIILKLVPSLKELLAFTEGRSSSEDLLDKESDVILIFILLLVSPLVLKRDLHALRHTCYVGFCSLIVLTGVVAYRSYETNHSNTYESTERKIKWFTDDWSDIVFAFPIISLAFFSSYNVLSVHGALVNPTRARIKFVLDGSIGLCFFFFYLVGICGYLHSYDETLDNIFLNFPVSDKAMLICRIGYGFTILFGMPLIVLPCREVILDIPNQLREWKEERMRVKKYIAMSKFSGEEGHLVINGVNFDEERPLIGGDPPQHSDSAVSGASYGSPSMNASQPSLDPIQEHPKSSQQDLATVSTADCSSADGAHQQHEPTMAEYIVHIVSTAVIIISCYITAVAVPGVATVWSICGSSMAILIGFTIPAAAYLKIRRRKKVNPRMIGAWSLLLFSIASSIICTSQTVASMGSDDERR